MEAGGTVPAGAPPVGKLPEGWPVMSIAAANARLTAPGVQFEMQELLIRGVKTRVWKNAPPTLRDLFLSAQPFAQREFLVYEDDRATYQAFDLAVRTLAVELQRQAVRKGDRVALIMRNLPE